MVNTVRNCARIVSLGIALISFNTEFKRATNPTLSLRDVLIIHEIMVRCCYSSSLKSIYDLSKTLFISVVIFDLFDVARYT
jgi:hypothetical protein